MSTGIKPGQVWRYGFMDVKVLRVDDGRVFYQYEPHSGSDGPGGKWDQPIEDFLGSSSLVKDTPAPMDPSKVKAGDTVTLENGETTVRGPVTNIEHAPHTEIVVGFAIQNIGWRYIEADVVAQQDAGVWSLTAHQPAPEPEPALPNTVGSVVLVRGMGGDAMALQLRPDTRRRVAWLHALGNPWVEGIVRDHLIEVLFDAGEVAR